MYIFLARVLFQPNSQIERFIEKKKRKEKRTRIHIGGREPSKATTLRGTVRAYDLDFQRSNAAFISSSSILSKFSSLPASSESVIGKQTLKRPRFQVDAESLIFSRYQRQTN